MQLQEKDKLDLFYVANHQMLERVKWRKQLHVVIQELTILPEHLSAFWFFMTRVAPSLVAVDLNFIIFRCFVLSCIGCPSSIYGF
jgi:hypothetical protein